MKYAWWAVAGLLAFAYPWVGIPLVILTLLYEFGKTGNQTSSNERPAPDEPEDPEDRMHREIRSAFENCLAHHPSATKSLVWLASVDGSLSKQELRQILRFCEKQGTEVPASVFKAIDAVGTESLEDISYPQHVAYECLAEISQQTSTYRVEYYGSARAVCGGSKKISAVKEKFLQEAASTLTT